MSGIKIAAFGFISVEAIKANKQKEEAAKTLSCNNPGASHGNILSSFQVALVETSTASLFEGFFSHIVSKPRYCLAFCNANWLCRTDVFESNDKSGKKGE